MSLLTERLSLDRLRSDVGSVQNAFSKIRPPQEFFDFRRLSKPANFGELQGRVGYNLGYFSANYGAIVGVLSIYALVTNLLLLFVIFLVVGGVYGISRLDGGDLTLPGFSFTTSSLYTALLIVSIPLIFVASPISTLMWLVGSLCVCVFSHALFMEKPIETVFEEEV